METNFELKNVTKTIFNEIETEYSLDFSNGEKSEKIILNGVGKLKEAVKI